MRWFEILRWLWLGRYLNAIIFIKHLIVLLFFPGGGDGSGPGLRVVIADRTGERAFIGPDVLVARLQSMAMIGMIRHAIC